MTTNWTEEEIKRYKENRKSELGPLYASAGIPIDHPGKRSKYLMELLDSVMTMTDYNVIMKIATTEGRDKALKVLEDFTIQTYF